MHGRYRSELSHYARELAGTQRRKLAEESRKRLELQQMRRAKRQSEYDAH